MAKANNVHTEPRVTVYIPKSEVNDGGVEVDQTEHVTVNGKTTIIQLGERVDIPVETFLVLRQKYPDL